MTETHLKTLQKIVKGLNKKGTDLVRRGYGDSFLVEY